MSGVGHDKQASGKFILFYMNMLEFKKKENLGHIMKLKDGMQL